MVEEGGATKSGVRRLLRLPQISATPWRRALVWRGQALGDLLRDELERELAERAGFQWLAVAFGAGCLAYFCLPREPLLWPLLVAAAAAATLAARGYERGGAWRIAAVIAVCLAGSTIAKLRTASLDGAQIERALSAELSGRVVDRDHRAGRRPRIVLDRLASEALAPGDTPDRIRLTLSANSALPPLGARVALRARLMPVAGPVVPGGYDPRRAAYFEAIGGSGFTLGAWRLVEPPDTAAPGLLVQRIRAAVVERILAIEPGEAGAVAAALLVGERSALSAETNDSLRASGLAHILSISGLHMMLIAGTAFFLVRAGLALSPRLALARPLRKWAAVAALAVVSVYFALSGGGAATLRAYVMAAVMFSAILLDRPAISMRNLAIAGFVVLMLEPESIVEPGFQMSFAAVAALIAAWDAWRDRKRLRLAEEAGPGLRLAHGALRAVAGVALTSLVAGLATAPFSAYHFDRVASYSLLGNLLAAPLVSLVIMPFGLLTLALMTVGLESLALPIMARGIDLLLSISGWVAALPGAEFGAPPMPPATLLAITAGLLWLCLWRRPWRLLAVAPVALGMLIAPALTDPADILVAADAKVVAVRDATGVLRISGGRSGSFAVEQLLSEEAEAAGGEDALRAGVACDGTACILASGGGGLVSHVRDPAAFAEDCRRARVVVTALPAPRDCAAALVIDAARLHQFGAHRVRIEDRDGRETYVVETERSAFPRPWQPRAAAQPAPPGALNISASAP